MSNVDKIKERLPITELLEGYLKLERAGRNFKSKCPFHQERTPSFFVSADRGSYYCFGCGAKGDIFTFIQEFEGLDFRGALKILAERTGVELQPENLPAKNEKDRLFQALESACLFFEQTLPKHPAVLNYLRKRGLKDETIKNWRLGYAPAGWNQLLDFLTGQNFQPAELVRAGLVKTSPQGKIYDVFRDRITFPLFDSASRPIAFSGRQFKEAPDSPKYLNSPETILFSKSETLYGLHRAKQAIRQKNYSILVEGQMDLLLAQQEGFANSIATSGTALTLAQLKNLRRLSERIIFAYDGDRAGWLAIEKSSRLALSLGLNVRIADLPSGEDPASLILKNRERWLKLLKQSAHIIDFYLEKIGGSRLPPRQQDRELRQTVLPLIRLLPSRIEQARFVLSAAERLKLPEDSLRSDLQNLPENQTAEVADSLPESPTVEAPNRQNKILKKLLGLWLWQKNLSTPAIDLSDLEKQLTGLAEGLTAEQLAARLTDREELIFEAEAYYGGRRDLWAVVSDLLLNLEEERLKSRLTAAMAQLAQAEQANQKEEAESRLLLCQEISAKINDLKNRRFLSFIKK